MKNLPEESYTEEVVAFGEKNALIGIITKPKEIVPGHPATILLNAGMLHRAGPCRSSVLLARRLASEGYISLRFDFSGIGDSGFNKAKIGPEDDSTTQEISAAVDLIISRFSISRIVLHGLCSGARNAFTAALGDERIVGISQIDSYSYRTYKYYLNKIKPKILDLSAWIRFLTLHSFRKNKKNRQKELNINLSTPEWAEDPNRKTVARHYQGLVKRGVAFLVVFTGTWVDTYNYESQFYDMFPEVTFNESLMLKFLPKANHLMTNPEHSEEFNNYFMEFISLLKN